jgi:hypothetical protein
MPIGVEYLPEPKLQFGDYFEHEDTKTGLAEFGPFGKSIPGLHPSEIRVGFVGTRETITDAREWVEECGTAIESENIKRIVERVREQPGGLFGDAEETPDAVMRREKILNRDFIGFNHDSPFGCCFQVNERWERHLQPREIASILATESKEDRIWQLVELFEGAIESLGTTGPSPDIIILALTPEMAKQAHSVRVQGNFFLDLRRALKARAMRWGIPVQLLQRRTVTGGRDVQEKATRAWNFCTAQYYKADGIPWRPVTLEGDVCFVGISFYVSQERAGKGTTIRSSVAQAFDHLGQGLVLRGDPFEWDEEQGRSPHLTQEAAHSLIRDVLKEYVKVSGRPPRRVVIHKTSGFWGSDHGVYNELEGIYAGIDEIFPGCESDLVALYSAGIRLFREGIYPPLRGTYFCLEGQQHFLYTMGFIPYLETYPGAHVPEPWGISEHHGGSSPKDLLREVLALTKMNVNNCAFADGKPITIRFAEEIGKIMKHVPAGETVQTKYKFYM